MKMLNEKTVDRRIISLTDERVYYEDGYWMTRKNYDFSLSQFNMHARSIKVSFDLDKETKELTPYLTYL